MYTYICIYVYIYIYQEYISQNVHKQSSNGLEFLCDET